MANLGSGSGTGSGSGKPFSAARHLDELHADDALLTAIARGEDPTFGSDPLAAALLGLRKEVAKDMPPAPNLADFGFDLSDRSDHSDRGDRSDSSAVSQNQDAQVVPLQARRRRVGRVASGLIGAAAATLVIAGGGSMIYSATPGSPLYSANQAVFGSNDAVVQLASKLEAADSLNARGDVEGARQVLAEAEALLEQMSQRQREQAQADLERAQAAIPQTVTEVRETTVTPEPGAPETVVEKITETVTETKTVTVTQTPSPTASVSSGAETPASTPAQVPAPSEPESAG
ncbi:hypothetical protein [Corynebacterium kozikiae]|uniref:hypothetical protein n=1 Tax=Corynebacterium kozikiae TaxID=2968469 RepID=UPI00211C9588|nr:hypothetical protein [Corynebacterium sp. 76QC2CO]MCQ9342526.1 hypothetical protein [Corynebacterium sp. 76QC2CO]